MKKIYLVLVVFFSVVFLNLSAQTGEILYDMDFSSTECLDAFQTAISKYDPIPDVTDIRSIATGSSLEVKAGTVVNDFKFSGTIHTCNEYLTSGLWTSASFTSVCGREFSYDFRLRNGNDTYIESPNVSDSVIVYVYARNVHATTTSALNLDVNDGTGWTTLNTWSVPGYTKVTTTDTLLTYNIYKEGDYSLRLFRKESRFMNIFRIVIEKYEKDDSSIGIANSNKMIILGGKQSIRIESDSQEMMNVQVMDLLGKTILKTQTAENHISLPAVTPGVYLVKLKTSEGEFVQKVMIK